MRTILNAKASRGPEQAPSMPFGFLQGIRGALGLSLLLFLASGCMTGKGYPPTVMPGADAAAIIKTARGQLGACYRAGGSSPAKGFDCSGFTQWVFVQHGMPLPRQSSDQYQWGRQVTAEKLQQGDLVFFEVEKEGVSHVGIYVDRGWFIHCSSPRGGVREDRLTEGYWERHYMGARRILP